MSNNNREPIKVKSFVSNECDVCEQWAEELVETVSPKGASFHICVACIEQMSSELLGRLYDLGQINRRRFEEEHAGSKGNE